MKREERSSSVELAKSLKLRPAGPIPTQVGPFTYDKVAESIGRGGFHPRAQSRGVLIAAMILAIAFAALVVLTVAGVVR
jgi:hypothetical protein